MATSENPRSVYFTTLCVIAWSFLAVQFVLAFASLFSLQTMPESLLNLDPSDFEPDFYGGLAQYVYNVQKYGYLLYSLYVFSSLFSAIGVWFMWNGHRKGYVVLLLSSVWPPLASVLVHCMAMPMVMVIIGMNIFIVAALNVLFALYFRKI